MTRLERDHLVVINPSDLGLDVPLSPRPLGSRNASNARKWVIVGLLISLLFFIGWHESKYEVTDEDLSHAAGTAPGDGSGGKEEGAGGASNASASAGEEEGPPQGSDDDEDDEDGDLDLGEMDPVVEHIEALRALRWGGARKGRRKRRLPSLPPLPLAAIRQRKRRKRRRTGSTTAADELLHIGGGPVGERVVGERGRSSGATFGERGIVDHGGSTGARASSSTSFSSLGFVQQTGLLDTSAQPQVMTASSSSGHDPDLLLSSQKQTGPLGPLGPLQPHPRRRLQTTVNTTSISTAAPSVVATQSTSSGTSQEVESTTSTMYVIAVLIIAVTVGFFYYWWYVGDAKPEQDSPMRSAGRNREDIGDKGTEQRGDSHYTESDEPPPPFASSKQTNQDDWNDWEGAAAGAGAAGAASGSSSDHDPDVESHKTDEEGLPPPPRPAEEHGSSSESDSSSEPKSARSTGDVKLTQSEEEGDHSGWTQEMLDHYEQERGARKAEKAQKKVERAEQRKKLEAELQTQMEEQGGPGSGRTE